jgi:hypothetical protein
LNNQALDLTEGFNAKINQRQVSDNISLEQLGPESSILEAWPQADFSRRKVNEGSPFLAGILLMKKKRKKRVHRMLSPRRAIINGSQSSHIAGHRTTNG